ncbi:MAG: cytochrome c [Gammaproteobacteria bacterium]
MQAVRTILVSLVIVGAAIGGFVWSGVYDVGADAPHTRPVFRLLELTRDRSVDARAAGIAVPDLEDAERLRHGAGNYAAMCETCHLRPGLDSSELHRGLYPQPPELAAHNRDEPAHDFWVIKHGLKATGMPAWGKSMDDESIWGMVAFIQKLPSLSPAAYHTAVETSGGHSHGGPEDDADDHDHDHDEAHDHDNGNDHDKGHDDDHEHEHEH